MRPPQSNLGNCRVLVVDDNEANRDVLSRRIQRQGHTVTIAFDGRQALLRLREQAFDLVLLDIMMPEVNGYQVLEEIKADPHLRHIPVIMISAVDDVESVVKCIQLGAEDYLPKPFNPILLKARVSATLEKKRLRDQEQAYLKTVQQEMELGRRIQADFLPAFLPRVTGWEVAATFHPAREIAGDFYDAIVLPDERMGLVIADVCDKGVGAALFMALVRSLLRAFAEQAPPSDFAALNAVPLTNQYITQHHHNKQNHIHMFATLFFGVLNPATGNLTYINGGHEAPLLLEPSGKIIPLEPTGPAIGLMSASTFALSEVYFEPGSMLLAYTDGVTEARRVGGEMFGEERLLELVKQTFSSGAALMSQIEHSVRDYLADRPPADDITMLTVQRIKP